MCSVGTTPNHFEHGAAAQPSQALLERVVNLVPVHLPRVCVQSTDTAPSVVVTSFGSLPDGRPVQRFVLTNGSGLTATFISYGAALISLKCPDAAGEAKVCIFLSVVPRCAVAKV